MAQIFLTAPAASLWAATAQPGPATPPLTGAHKADVAVVGAGYTGLAAALRLAEGGASVIVVDSVEPGFGASGRNGGQVIPGLKYDPDMLDEVYGEATTAFVGNSAQFLFSLVERHGIDCDARQQGWIQASLKETHLPGLESRMAQWRRRGAPVEMLDRDAMARHSGSARFAGGWIDRRAGAVHPLNYARGLARAALTAGAAVHGGSPATALRREAGSWSVEIGTQARITAGQVILATNGYSDSLLPGLKATLIPANSFQVATAPLPAAILAAILPKGRVLSDSRRVANYFRIGPGDRLIMGGRGSFREPRSVADYRRIENALRSFFPQVGPLPIDFRWAGRVAITRDFLPHVHQPLPGLTVALGYNGRGVALASALGTAIGAQLLDRSQPLPLKLTDIKPMPLHGLYPLYASAMIWYYRLRDALER